MKKEDDHYSWEEVYRKFGCDTRYE